MKSFPIGQRSIGDGSPCFVIAEAGINHNGDIDMARELVRSAAAARCDAVKFQTYRVSALGAANAPMAEYQKANTGLSGSQADLLTGCELDFAKHQILVDECRAHGIQFLSTPFLSLIHI